MESDMLQESLAHAIYALVLQDFPESLVETMVVFSLLNIRLRDKRILAVAVLQTLTNLIRYLPITFGMHSVVLIISLAIYTRLLTGTRLSWTFLAVLICVAMVAAAELAYTGPLLKLTGLTYERSFADPFLRAAFALPYEVLLLMVALGKNYYNLKRGLTC
ncbi:hypothetical protein [Moorella sp. Hama-1]|uniref:hypothetical protein n=1 Tax=Moorella sp. Hama-1 TaxID=2138101 RepID=UPI00324241CA